MKSAVLNLAFIVGALALFTGLWWASPSVAMATAGVLGMGLGVAGHVLAPLPAPKGKD